MKGYLMWHTLATLVHTRLLHHQTSSALIVGIASIRVLLRIEARARGYLYLTALIAITLPIAKPVWSTISRPILGRSLLHARIARCVVPRKSTYSGTCWFILATSLMLVHTVIIVDVRRLILIGTSRWFMVEANFNECFTSFSIATPYFEAA